MINNNINDLTPNFREKVKLFLQDAANEGFKIKIFEGLRTLERQKQLYAQGRTTPGKIVTWTMQSKHLTGDAVDIVFVDEKGNPSWSGNYDRLIEIAKKYGIDNLKPKETAHFQDNGLPITPNSKPAMPSKYTEVMNSTLKETGFEPIFSSHDGDTPLTEKETKELIEIAFARMSKRKK